MASKILQILLTLACFSAVEAFQCIFSSPRQSNSQLSACWSDSKAVKDYQDFLSSGKQEVDRSSDQPSVIITSDEGASPVLTQALVKMGMGDDVVLKASADLPDQLNGNTEYPIYITLPPWQVEEFLVKLPESWMDRNEDFCFFSGGMSYGNLEDVLKSRGYCRDAMTQCLISGMKLFPDMPDRRVEDLSINLGKDSVGEDKIAGSCTACGKWAGSIAERLTKNQVTCDVDFYREWRRKMWERSFLDAVFTVLGAVRDQPTTIAQVANYYEEEASDLLWDCSQKLRGWRAVTLLYGFEERLFGMAERNGADDQCQIPEEMFDFIWGNNVFMESKELVDYLVYAKNEMGLLPNTEHKSFSKPDEAFASRMRKGNMRADGVL